MSTTTCVSPYWPWYYEKSDKQNKLCLTGGLFPRAIRRRRCFREVPTAGGAPVGSPRSRVLAPGRHWVVGQRRDRDATRRNVGERGGKRRASTSSTSQEPVVRRTCRTCRTYFPAIETRVRACARARTCVELLKRFGKVRHVVASSHSLNQLRCRTYCVSKVRHRFGKALKVRHFILARPPDRCSPCGRWSCGTPLRVRR